MRLICVLGALLVATPAAAQSTQPPLGGESFNIDLVTGPVLGTGRVVGLGGAYTALSYGADGAAWNPSAYASRTLWEIDWFEWDVAFDYSPGTLSKTDFDNNGESGFKYSDFLFLTLGTRFVFGAVGFGGLVRFQDYRVDNATVELIIANLGSSYAFMDGQLIVGLAARVASLEILDTVDRSLASFTGTGPELGLLIAPAHQRYRIGASARLAVDAEKNDTARIAAGLTLPRQLVLPAEAQLGFAYQLGKRPLNRRFENPHDVDDKLRDAMLAARAAREREQSRREAFANQARFAFVPTPHGMRRASLEDSSLATPKDSEWWSEELRQRALENQALQLAMRDAEAAREAEVTILPRQYLLLSAETTFIGTTDNGVGFESFLRQRRQQSGNDVSFGFRFGAETEPLQNRWKVRAGTYFEPSRFAGVPYRVHGTIDSEVRLFRWDVFGFVEPFDVRIGASFDIAARYSNFGFGLGIWH